MNGAQKYSILGLTLILLATTAGGAEIKYRVSDIPAELLANAKAVVRNEDIRFTVNSTKSALKSVTYAVTILNENGLQLSYFMEHYNKQSSVRSIKGAIYDRDGKLVKKINHSDIIDHSAISGASVFEDNRIKLIDPAHKIYPFTVEYSFEISYSEMIDYPDWYILPDYNVSVERSSYTALVPEGFEFRYHASHLEAAFSESVTKGVRSFTWSVESMPAMLKESFTRPLMEVIPVLFTAPAKFSMDGYDGDASSWESFGKWIYDLGLGRNVLKPGRVDHLNELIADARSETEKVKILYEYMQDRTRYVSIQVGIGSWQPFEAGKVDEICYGDCKALSNYMKSMLEAIGIPSYYTLVRAGESAARIITDFPSNQFNHVILCVPVDGDTVWLECTNQRIPFGYLGSFTDDRVVLLVTQAGGVLSRTREYDREDNYFSRKAKVVLDEEGMGAAEVLTRYSGIFYDDISSILYLDDVDKKKAIIQRIRIPSFQLQSHGHQEDRSMVPCIQESLGLTLPHYCTIMGDRFLLPLNMETRHITLEGSHFERKSEIEIRREVLYSDTVIYTIPSGFRVDNMPESNELVTEFATYRYEVSAEGEQVRYVRRLQWNKGIYPPEKFRSFREFLEKLEKYDGLKCILKRAES